MTLTRFQASFLALVGTQAAHSIEEYLGRLYEVFLPARIVSGLVSPNLERGFIAFNGVLVGFGVWCFLWPVRKHWAAAVPLGWLWVTLELVNGIGHPLWSLSQLRYTPGLATAPVLLVLALTVARQLLAGHGSSPAPPE
jgi:hypothetical protein